MNINKLNIFFNPNSTNKTWFCRSCNNSFYSKLNMMIMFYIVKQLNH